MSVGKVYWTKVHYKHNMASTELIGIIHPEKNEIERIWASNTSKASSLWQKNQEEGHVHHFLDYAHHHLAFGQ